MWLSLCLYIGLTAAIQLDPRIINGVDQSADEYPWVVSLRGTQSNQYFQQSTCTGSLIQVYPPIILTAAHCFKTNEHAIVYNATDDTLRALTYEVIDDNDTSSTSVNLIIELFVDVNRTYLYTSDETSPQDSFVALQFEDLSEVYIHPGYNLSDETASIKNDIALIIFKDYDGTELDGLVDLLPQLPTQQLATDETCCQRDEDLVSLGYGTMENDSNAEQLQRTDVENVSPLACVLGVYSLLNISVNRTLQEREFEAEPDYAMVCTIGNETNVCSGDSGGPLFRLVDGEQVELVGVANSVLGACDDPDWAAFSVSIAHQYDWMQSTIEEALGAMDTTEMPAITIETMFSTTAETETTEEMSTTAVTAPETTDVDDGDFDVYSIHGSFSVYDVSSGDLFTAIIGVNSDCSKVQFSLHSPANAVWFAIGIGGDYDHESSEEADSAESHSYNSSDAYLMNGYAIVSAGIGANDVYETILQPGVAPQNQEEIGGVNDLDCTKIRTNGRRIVVCERAYETGDSLDDFNQFVQGANPVIFAFGAIAITGELLQHGAGLLGYGDAEVGVVYLDQRSDLCGYAEEYAAEQRKEDKEDEAWMIVGIVFIVLFVIAVGVIIYLVIKGKKGGSGQAGYQTTAQADY